ncbi:MAG: hypothetical protein HY901_23465, partial [Deltaproteobacteria bacterium]|nr:hypothetical protein [Deltaproteobacteria bacterium]
GGATCFPGDFSRQVEATLENLEAALRQTGCAPKDVVHAVAYCENEEARRLFEERWSPQLAWPTLAVVADVCRPDLAFEIEATAVR